MIELELQNVSQASEVPDVASFERWAEAALQREAAELVIRVVDEDESAELNSQYRHKAGSTNVLSFPFEAPPGVDTTILGDLVICAPVVAREAREQGKAPVAHWAHMVVHGVLHLQGYDHIDDAEAMTMEAEEVAIMGRLGFANPYEDET